MGSAGGGRRAWLPSTVAADCHAHLPPGDMNMGAVRRVPAIIPTCCRSLDVGRCLCCSQQCARCCRASIAARSAPPSPHVTSFLQRRMGHGSWYAVVSRRQLKRGRLVGCLAAVGCSSTLVAWTQPNLLPSQPICCFETLSPPRCSRSLEVPAAARPTLLDHSSAFFALPPQVVTLNGWPDQLAASGACRPRLVW